MLQKIASSSKLIILNSEIDNYDNIGDDLEMFSTELSGFF